MIPGFRECIRVGQAVQRAILSYFSEFSGETVSRRARKYLPYYTIISMFCHVKNKKEAEKKPLNFDFNGFFVFPSIFFRLPPLPPRFHLQPPPLPPLLPSLPLPPPRFHRLPPPLPRRIFPC
jgi:hypothetical protein